MRLNFACVTAAARGEQRSSFLCACTISSEQIRLSRNLSISLVYALLILVHVYYVWCIVLVSLLTTYLSMQRSTLISIVNIWSANMWCIIYFIVDTLINIFLFYEFVQLFTTSLTFPPWAPIPGKSKKLSGTIFLTRFRKSDFVAPTTNIIFFAPFRLIDFVITDS